MFRNGVASFLKAGTLTDTVCMEERKALPAATTNRSSVGWFLDECDMENFGLSDDGGSFVSDEDGDGGGMDNDSGNPLDEMDEEDAEEIEEEDVDEGN